MSVIISSDRNQTVTSPVFDEDQLKTDFESAQQAERDLRKNREISRTALQSVKDTFLRLDIGLTETCKQRKGLEDELGKEGERHGEVRTLHGALEAEKRLLADVSKEAASLRTNAPDLESIAAAHSRAISAIERVESETVILNREVAGLDGRIKTHSGEGIEDLYQEVKGKREAVESRVAAFRLEVDGLFRLKEVLEAARSSAKEQYFKPVMAELKPLLTLLLDEASITFDDATLLPQTLARNGQDEDISSLSGGMREQLAVLTRLAFARLLAKGGHPVPVILDDALVYSDDDRIERMFNALHRQAKDIQILVFTCRQRAFERLGGNGLHMTAWQPGTR